MLFNSIEFAIFLPIVFVLYWFITNKNLQLQNILILLSSYLFYGWWDWRFLSLIFFSTIIDYYVGIGLSNQKNKNKRKTLLGISIIVNLGFLGFFKYYNFFIENFIAGFSFFGTELKASSLNIILPIGISFYTFQTLSYSIDVYKKRLEPTKNFIAFAAFVSFFPQLVAGPIERAKNLLPQFYSKRQFDYSKSVDGMRQILWGLFKKMVIADNCAEYANIIFDNSSEYSGSTLVVGAILFSFQIYGDFSGYSDIAIGSSRLFGFNLKQNFATPYFSRDIAEFWRRWHISLSTWFRDYVYIPLGGSHGGVWSKIRNIFIIFIVSGFWHGSNWTFVIWGILNAFYFLPYMITKKNRNNIIVVAKGKRIPNLLEFTQISITFAMTAFAWIFFRAEDIGHAFRYISTIFSNSLFSFPTFHKDSLIKPLYFLILLFIIIEWLGREHQYAIERFKTYKRRWVRWFLYLSIVYLILLFKGGQQEFIYFQF